ncbi:MAG: TATA-box-binding protein [Candidatus Thermoplasmatota archaeon]|jgi:transcription initiation factor TFIID TATA-box-binding protein|nr:TATA-box-binding protein [Candidatus Thermoplasmatota archaeon]
MVDINVENIVVSAQLAEKIDIKSLAEKIPDSKYNPDEFPGLILHFEEQKTAALIFSSGKVICTGAKSIEQAKETITTLISEMKKNGIDTPDEIEVITQNIVASADLKKDLQLSSIAKGLLLENVEYEPEQFPGLVYKMSDIGAVILLFSSGKMVCTGAKKMDDVHRAIDTMKEKLSSLGVL